MEKYRSETPKYEYNFSVNDKSLESGLYKKNISSQRNNAILSVFIVLQIITKLELETKIINFIKSPKNNFTYIRKFIEIIITYVNQKIPRERFMTILEGYNDCLRISRPEFDKIKMNDDYFKIYLQNYSDISQGLMNWCNMSNNRNKLHIFTICIKNYQQNYTLIGLNDNTQLRFMLIDTYKSQLIGFDEYYYSDIMILEWYQLVEWIDNKSMKIKIIHWSSKEDKKCYRDTLTVYNYIQTELYRKHTYEFARNNGYNGERQDYLPKDLIRAVCKNLEISYSDNLLSNYIRLLPDINKTEKILIYKSNDKAKRGTIHNYAGRNSIVATKLLDGKIFSVINPYYF